MLRLFTAAALIVIAPLASAQQAAPKGDAKAAHDRKIAMCIGCHGIPGYKTAFPSVYHVPKIAGQQPGYIVSALRAYKSGERSHPSMRGIAASLTDEDMADLAAYYGAETKSVAAGHARGNMAAGKAKAAQVCAACHGAEGNKPSDPTQPILAAQHYDYLVRALSDYKSGQRSNGIMKGFAATLSKQDIEDLAAWFASQKSSLHDQR
jgi:cytochrome c553